MTASSPVFGIGIGRYYSRSGEFSSQELLTNFPPAIHENAHNNFLQILAELGMLGLASALWLLMTAANYGRRLLAADERDPVRWSLATGLVAFVVSWLGGHPLLIDEPAFAFWLLLGTLAGWGASFDVASSPKRLRDWVVVAAILGIAVSVPIRADRQKADFNLEHRGVGLSTWRDAVDGVRYRLAGSASSVFVPAHVPTVTIPMRATGERDLRVELRLDGRPADVLTVPADRWHFLRFSLPQNREGPRFHRLDFAVVSPTTTSDGVLMIGKVEPK
jgi:hypothetical protein